MGVALINNALEVEGNNSGNRFAGTEYFTSLDASTSVTVGTLVVTNTRINPGVQGTLDIGTTTKPAAGINGNDITITSQPGSDYSGGLGPGLGGDSTLKGGTGGLGDAIIVPSADGGDVYVEGGPAGANLGGGVGADGNINLGLNDTSAIIIGSIHMLWNVDGGGNIGYDGSTNYRPDRIRAKTSVSAGDSITLKGDRLSVSGGTGDPGTLVAGDLWYRTDLGKFKFRNATTAVELLDASTAIANPGTKANNDILQYKSGTTTWDAVGGASGDPVLGTLYTSALTIVGTTNTAPLLWNSDNQNDIGASGATRPRTIYAGTSIYQGSNQVLDAGTAHAGDVTGTNGATVVARIQGDAVSTTNPSNNQGLVWTGSEYAPKSHAWFPVASQAVNATSVTVDSLAGGTHYAYEIILHGYWAATGSQKYVYLTPRTSGGDQTGNQYSHRHYAGVEPGVGSVHSITSIASRLILHMNDWNHSQDIFVHAHFFAATGTYNRRLISHTVKEEAGKTGAGEQGKFLEAMYHGVWRDTSSAITGLKIDFNGATFVGYLQINALRIA